MGRRGPAPLPTRVKLLHGETRPSRLNRNEPHPPADVPVMPDDLLEAAKPIWERVLAAQAPGVILAAHAEVFRIYCESAARYAEASNLLARSGLLLRDGHHGGAPVKNPLCQIVRDNADQVRVLARELGLTPSSLSGVHAAPAPEDSAMLALLTPRRRTG